MFECIVLLVAGLKLIIYCNGILSSVLERVLYKC